MAHALPQLVAPTTELHAILAQVHHASSLFANPDPELRSRGEAIFLHVRQGRGAIDFACFALAHTQDAFVLFQAFQAVLDNLPTLALTQPTANVASLSTLRDFLLAIILARSTMDKTSKVLQQRTAKSSSSSANSWSESRSVSWPKYTQARAYQAFAAVEKRTMGLEVEAEYQQGGAVQDAIHRHTEYVFAQLTSLLVLPAQWPTQEENFLTAQSNFAVGVGVMNALLDDAGCAFTTLATEGNTKGKAKSVDYSGLLPLQHRWCKAIIQTYALPALLDTTLQALNAALPGQPHCHQPFLFSPLVSLAQRIVGWDFVVDEPFVGLEGPVSVERQKALLEQDERSRDDDEDGDDDEKAEAGSAGTRAGKPLSRPIPNTHSVFLSNQVTSLLHLAYQHACQMERERNLESFYCISELRRCILNVASYRLVVHTDSDRHTVVQAKQGQLASITSVVALTCNDPAAAQSTGTLGASLLFLSQLFLSFLTSTDEREALTAAVDVPHLATSLTQLTGSIFRLAFEPREDSDEEDDLVQVGDEAVDNILACWRALLPRSYETTGNASTTQLFKGIVFGSVVRPYIEQRLVNAGSTMDRGDGQGSEFGQEVQSDTERYEEQLITLASLARESDMAASLAYLIDVCTPIVQELHRFYHTGEESSTGMSAEEERRMESVWEQAHWVTLIAGHVLADRSKGEVAVLAQEIAILSDKEQSNALRLIQSLGLSLLEMFTKPSSRVQSPRVAETVLWFNARWIPVLLLVQTTPLLSSHLSGPTGQEVLQYLLVRLQEAVALWSSDADVVLQVAAVVKALTLSEGVMQLLLGLSSFQAVVKVITDGLDLLPAKTHGPLISAIVGCIYSSSSPQSPEHFFEYIKHAVETRLGRVIHQPGFATSQVSQQSETISSLLNALDMLDGLASSVQPKSATAVYDFIARFFPTLVGLVQLYSERSEVVTSIIRVYRTLIGALDLGFGVPEGMVTGLNAAVSALLSALDEKSLLGDDAGLAMEEEVPFEGLNLVMELLSDLMLASDGDAGDARQWCQPLSVERTSDVCLQGFARLASILSTEAQSVVKVQRRFANLTSKLWISFPHRIIGILISSPGQDGVQLFGSCISALIISLGFVESSLIVDCFAAIRTLPTATERVFESATPSSSADEVVGEALTKVLTTILRGVLIDPLATSLLDAHLLCTRSLLQNLASTRMGGMSMLESRVEHFCQSTGFGSEIGSMVIRRDGHGLRPEEEAQKRTALRQVVNQLAGLSFTGQVASSLNSSQGRQDQSVFLKQARRVAWEGRAKIRTG